MLTGDNIKKFREAAGLSKTELAQKCGLSRNSIYKYEKNEMVPKIEQLKKISTALGVPVSNLSGDNSKEFVTLDFKPVINALRKQVETESLNLTSESFKKIFFQRIEDVKKELDIPDQIIIEIPPFINADYAFKQNDDSMEDVGININDIVFTQVLEEYYSGDIVLVSIDGELKTRRVFFENNIEIYIPENKKYDLKIIKTKKEENRVEYWGKVTAVLKQLK